MTEEGAFLRGQIRMEETVELDLEPAPETTPSEAAQARIHRVDTHGHPDTIVRGNDPKNHKKEKRIRTYSSR